MKKRIPIIFNIILICWFFLDMVGVYIGDNYLVTTSYKEDGIFFLLFLISLLFFVIRENVGKYVLSGWLTCWFLTQFFSHWFYTIAGNAQRKIDYFADAIKLVESDTIYIPDIYHIILHLFILAALIATITFCFKTRKVSCNK